MGGEMKTLRLTYPHLMQSGKDGYKVVEVEQDVSIRVGTYLEEIAVKDLCEMTGTWKVIIKSNKETR